MSAAAAAFAVAGLFDDVVVDAVAAAATLLDDAAVDAAAALAVDDDFEQRVASGILPFTSFFLFTLPADDSVDLI